MCARNPIEMLELSRARLTPEQWEKFEADFEHFCDYSGLMKPIALEPPFHLLDSLISQERANYAWAKWSYLCGKGL